MKILIRQFLGQLHSWSVTGWGEARALKSLGHQVDLYATDGIKHLPLDLKENLIGYNELNSNKVIGKIPDKNYDMQISYTAMINFSNYLSNAKNKFGIWLYEWNGKNILPASFAKQHKYCSYLISPSTFGKEVFVNSGIPKENIKVIPHGIDVGLYQNTTTIKLPTDKKYKIGVVLAQNHLRKNIVGMLEAYGKAFSNKDDVCLIIKGKSKPVSQPFDVSLNDCIVNFNKKYPQHAEIKIFSEFIPDMSAFYRSIDTIYTLAFCEGFYMPGLEGIAAGKMSLAPCWGGQLDFLNTNNSLLISGKEERANPKSMYWEPKQNAIWFVPDINDAADKLRYAYANFETINSLVDRQRVDIYEKYNWKNVSLQFVNLCK